MFEIAVILLCFALFCFGFGLFACLLWAVLMRPWLWIPWLLIMLCEPLFQAISEEHTYTLVFICIVAYSVYAFSKFEPEY